MWMPQHAKHPLFRFGCIVDDTDPERIAVLAWMEAQRGQRLERRRRHAAERNARNACKAQQLRLAAPSWAGLFGRIEFTPEEEAALDAAWASPKVQAAVEVPAIELRMVLDD